MEYFAYSQKAFVYKYVVMLSDTDQFKHMSFANYLRLMFLASDALFVDCYNKDFLEKYRLRAKESRMQFKQQTTVGDQLLIKLNASKINGNQFSLLYTYVIEGSGELVGLARQQFELLPLNGHDGVSNVIMAPFKTLLTPIAVDEGNLLYKY